MKIRKIKYSEYSNALLEAMPKGILLCAKDKDRTNVTTIGWCLMGYMWNRPIFQVAILKSRYTHELMEASGEFTVNVSLSGDIKREIGICGTQSGRNRDKIDLCHFSLAEAQLIDTPLIENCDLFLECRIVAKTRLPVEHIEEDVNLQDANLTDLETKDSCDAPYHIMYYGEVVSSYVKES